ncbi:SDR family oxidoreductase [Sulfitobacter mediterraneus]|uniref:SDR family oxidoreductase n=1 Tax=Sulfitobacter mediterraneus TaxID=83219 RepID=UPI0019317AB2|nr:SDR family NAD(P)-dependent oxidoreductase [Sulfitobacter mediterraneus]MBM1634645.1 SDR family oxidoreductase [Sulfitobacter mediterraneus]MBM1642463.1 SDR family oxidoreductase [Sulfitobacter mediterraneus]MBM1646511.1 SDR family oxidoreductase [Sulfitobacter mediterraneus]MBM1650557.1 SDR family oxidoreductase [Sulfitobacter mediterraneus]MBM1654579.1 SDR family oxidoreductase [Sulfitobacter mediterraneus]
MKSIIITGASSGIGRATAELFLREGWRVGLVARRADVLEEMAAAHEKAVALPADVTDADAMQTAFDRFGDLNVLFNNAGMFGPSGPIDEIALEDWAQVMAVNIQGMFIAARLAFGRMRGLGGGRIINNGSLSAHVPRPGSVCYTTTKHAITGLTRTLSLDGRAHNIACGQIDIGNAESDMVAALKEKQPEMQTMDVAHAAQSVLHMAQMPLEANVQFLTVMATKMPYIGRG